MFSLLDQWPSIFAASGRLPRRVGNRHLAAVPYDAYQAQDGFLVIAVASNKLFRRLCAAIDRPDLGDDPRFRGVTARLEHGDEINAIVAEWVAKHTVDEVIALLGPDGAGVPCSPVNTIDQLVDHPQLVARGMIQRIAHEKLGELLVPGVVIKMSDTPGAIRTLGPELGQHTDEVLRSLLGLSSDDLARLRTAQVI